MFGSAAGGTIIGACSNPSSPTSGSRSDGCGEAPASRSWPSLRSRSASASTPRFSPSSTPSCSNRCRLPTPSSWWMSSPRRGPRGSVPRPIPTISTSTRRTTSSRTSPATARCSRRSIWTPDRGWQSVKSSPAIISRCLASTPRSDGRFCRTTIGAMRRGWRWCLTGTGRGSWRRRLTPSGEQCAFAATHTRSSALRRPASTAWFRCSRRSCGFRYPPRSWSSRSGCMTRCRHRSARIGWSAAATGGCSCAGGSSRAARSRRRKRTSAC